MKISLQSKIKYSIGYCDNPVNTYHGTYKVAVNMLLLSSVSLTVSLFVLLTGNVNLMSYFISGIIAALYLLIWKAILFPTGNNHV
jgi:hypothetical protein